MRTLVFKVDGKYFAGFDGEGRYAWTEDREKARRVTRNHCYHLLREFPTGVWERV